jgi:hypothetical protein
MTFGIVTHGDFRLAIGLPGAAFPQRLRFTRSRAKLEQPTTGLGGKQTFRVGAEAVAVDDLHDGNFAEEFLIMIAGQVLHGGEPPQRGIEFRLQARAGENDPALATGSLHDPLVAFAFTIGQGDMLAGTGEAFGLELVLDLLEFLVEKAELLVDRVATFDELREVDFGF